MIWPSSPNYLHPLQEAEQSKFEAANLREVVQKLESELEDLSNAYAMLDAHSRGLQAQFEEERSRHAEGKWPLTLFPMYMQGQSLVCGLLSCVSLHSCKVWFTCLARRCTQERIEARVYWFWLLSLLH